jgi:glycosyltransferase involved in cell wall biosynthesis
MTSVSVAVCTYEGERFLGEQLASIAAQTRLPDEVVLCDDGSCDATLTMVRAFAAAAPFTVRVLEGEGEPLGPARNFERALRAASGDVIVLCDQDDVWPAHRLERVGQVLAQNPDAVAMFTDADLIDERSQPLGETLWEALGIAGRTQRRFTHGTAAERVRVLCDGNVVTGATLAVREEALEYALPVPDGWLHDYWLAIILSSVAEVVMWPEPLCRYRIHDAQHTGLGTRRPPRRYFVRRRAQLMRRLEKDERGELGDQAAGFALILDHIAALDGTVVDRGVVEFLETRRMHFEARATFADGRRRFGLVARELLSGRYHRHSNGLSSAMKDLLLRDVRR